MNQLNRCGFVLMAWGIWYLIISAKPGKEWFELLSWMMMMVGGICVGYKAVPRVLPQSH